MRPFVPGAHLTDRPEDLDQLTGGEDPFEGDDIVQLEVLAFAHADPELEGVASTVPSTRPTISSIRPSVDPAWDRLRST